MSKANTDRQSINMLLLFVIINLSICTYAVAANNITSLFYAGNALYEQGQYEKARDQYESIIKRGYAGY